MSAIVIWLSVWITSAHATGIHTTDAPCPIDDTDTVKLYFQISSNEFGGFDSDGATYSSGTQFREHAISTCTKSLFSTIQPICKHRLVQMMFKKSKLGWDPLPINTPILRHGNDTRSQRSIIAGKENPLYLWGDCT